MLPLVRTARCRMAPSPSATTVAWKPGGNVNPSGSPPAINTTAGARINAAPNVFIGCPPTRGILTVRAPVDDGRAGIGVFRGAADGETDRLDAIPNEDGRHRWRPSVFSS